MPAFATETDLRELFRLADTTLVPAALIERGIDAAHADLLRLLDPIHDVDPPAADLVHGEALLAGAQVFRAIAAGEAFATKRIVIGGQRIDDSNRFEILHATARDADDRAWATLAPYLVPEPARAALDVSATKPVLGEE